MMETYHLTSILCSSEQLIRATEYLLKWCPLEDEHISHATWLDFENRLSLQLLL